MKNTTTLKMQSKKLWTGIALGMVLWAPTLTWAQASNSVNLSISNESFLKQAEGVFNIDLLAEIRKVSPASTSVEIQMIRVDAKAGLGGAQLVLKINNQGNDTQVVDTDPAQYNVDDASTFKRYELKNMDRTTIRSAVLAIQNVVKIKSIEVVLGTAQDVTIMGRYVQDAAAVIGGGSDNADTRPTTQAQSEILANYYGADDASIQALQQAQQKPAVTTQVQTQVPVTTDPVDSYWATQKKAEIRQWIADGLYKAQRDDVSTSREYLSYATSYLSELRLSGTQILLEDEIVAYINQLKSIVTQKEQAYNVAQAAKVRQTQQQAAVAAARPKVNYNAPVKCLKAAKKKAIGNKKEFCIGEFLPGLYPQHNAPQIIDIDKRANALIILFDYSNQPMSYPVDSLPNK